MNILFWNTHENYNINPYIASIVKDHDVGIIVLAEYVADGDQLVDLVSKNGHRIKEYITDGCKRIRIFGKYISVEPAEQSYYYSIQIINEQYILCGVHLPSRLYTDAYTRDSKIREIIRDIHNNEDCIDKELKTAHTIIVGDFNEMPYEYGCLGADTFHGIPVFEQDTKNKRTVLGTEYRKYYNPMWNFFGDFSYPYGTYYYDRSEILEPQWFIFDQFFLGAELAPCVRKDDVEIITKCSAGNLADKKGHPSSAKISDHFPIFCRIKEDCLT